MAVNFTSLPIYALLLIQLSQVSQINVIQYHLSSLCIYHSWPQRLSFTMIDSFSEEPTKAPLVKNGSCPDEFHGATSWLKHGSYCYLPVSEYKTWHEARLHCAKYGTTSNLVSIHSESENKFVLENMPKPSSWTSVGWIGLYRHTKGNDCGSLNCLFD